VAAGCHSDRQRGGGMPSARLPRARLGHRHADPSSRRSLPPWWLWRCRARRPRRSPTSAGASARSLAQTCSTSTRCRIWAPQSLRSAGPEPSTASFSPAYWRCCWRAFFRSPGSGIALGRIRDRSRQN
jgi:hypothetical protein